MTELYYSGDILYLEHGTVDARRKVFEEEIGEEPKYVTLMKLHSARHTCKFKCNEFFHSHGM